MLNTGPGREWNHGPNQWKENTMNTQHIQDPEAPMEMERDLEDFVITAADEEAIRDAVEQQLRGLPVRTPQQE